MVRQERATLRGGEAAADLSSIRRFFLEPGDAYSFTDLARLWRVDAEQVREIFSDGSNAQEVEDPAAATVAWVDALGTGVAYNLLRPYDVERALGAEFRRFRPEAWRTVPVLLHLPAFVAAAIASDAFLQPALTLPEQVEQFVLECFRREHRGSFQ